MKSYLPRLKALIPFGTMILLAGVFTFVASADSTISIPVDIPVNNPDRNVTLSLKIPANTQPLTRKEQMQPAIQSNRIHIWNSTPLVRLSNDDEIHGIFSNLNRKGWVKSNLTRHAISLRPVEKCFAVRSLIDISNNVVDIGRAKNFNQAVKKVNLTASDVEDLRRMVKRFEIDIVMFGGNPKKLDKDLLVIQESLRKQRQNILKVLKVEGNDDGSTIIHMTID